MIGIFVGTLLFFYIFLILLGSRRPHRAATRPTPYRACPGPTPYRACPAVIRFWPFTIFFYLACHLARFGLTSSGFADLCHLIELRYVLRRTPLGSAVSLRFAMLRHLLPNFSCFGFVCFSNPAEGPHGGLLPIICERVVQELSNDLRDVDYILPCGFLSRLKNEFELKQKTWIKDG